MPTYTELLPKTKSEKHGALVWEPAESNVTSPVAGILTLMGTRSHCRYKVSEFPADMTGRAFLLEKLGAGTDATEGHYAWRDRPDRFGNGNTVWRRFRRGAEAGVWGLR